MNHPKLLAFDTSGPHCAGALLIEGQMTTRVDDMARGQAEHLMPMLEEMLAAAGVSWSDLDGIGVGVGPGNFTGIRISVSAARGLSLGLGKPAIGVSVLEAQVFDVPRPCIAIVPAPREMAYRQFFGPDGAAAPELVKMAEEMAPPISAQECIENMVHIAMGRIDDAPSRPTPLYIREPDAAPPKITAPTILP